MNRQQPRDKKEVEKHYLLEAMKLSAVFPAGTLMPSEQPDFLLHHDNGTIGIEVTELCEEAARAEGGRLAKIAGTAQDRYNRLPGVVTVDVSAAFTPTVESVRSKRLVKGLTDFVAAHQDHRGGFNWNTYALPEGYCHIGIHAPLEPARQWQIAAGFAGNVSQK